MKAINIKWDTDGDMETLAKLPKEIRIPEEITEEISDYLSEVTGFCHDGFDVDDEEDLKEVYMGNIGVCDCTLIWCEQNCGKYPSCANVAIANDILVEREMNVAKE